MAALSLNIKMTFTESFIIYTSMLYKVLYNNIMLYKSGYQKIENDTGFPSGVP